MLEFMFPQVTQSKPKSCSKPKSWIVTKPKSWIMTVRRWCDKFKDIISKNIESALVLYI